MRPAVLLCVLSLVSACTDGGRSLPATARPSAVPSLASPPPSPPATGAISIGEEVNDTITSPGGSDVYELTAPSTGTLVARVSYEPGQAVVLYLADQAFESDTPIVGRLPVVAGRQYRVEVAIGDFWGYGDVFVRFVLTTSIE